MLNQFSSSRIKTFTSALMMIVMMSGCLMKDAMSQATPRTAPPEPEFTISPSIVQQGKDYEVLLTSNQCLSDPTKNPLTDVVLYAPQGSRLTISGQQTTACTITAKVAVSSDAIPGNIKLWLKKGTNPVKTIDLTVTEIAPGPIPPGLGGQGQVDVMWSVLPDNVVYDNFGKKISHEYFCIDVVIGNDSGYDLQISSIGFTIPELNPENPEKNAYIVPTIGYRMARGTLEREQQVGVRVKLLAIITSMGPLLTGFTPFFHAINHRANFTEGINIFSNPFEKGFESAVPDTTIRHLDRLADQTWRDDNSARTIVQNNTQLKLTTFVPKAFLYPPISNKTRSSASTKGGGKGGQGSSNVPPDDANVTAADLYAGDRREKSYGKERYEERKDPMIVMRRLGQVVLIGDVIQHTNRIRVVSNQQLSSLTDFPISGRVLDDCRIGVPNVEVTLTGGAGFEDKKVKTDSAGDYIFNNVPAERTYSLSAKLEGATFTLERGNGKFILRDPRSNVDFTATLNPFPITGKITNTGTTGDLKKIAVTLKLNTQELQTVHPDENGVYKFDVKDKPIKGAYEIALTSTDFTFEPASREWTCSKRDTNFKATKKP
ncbi:MAG: carboxypeptidase-like regulatory domain-containing protein [Pyrinomonadaceae bacterium]